MHKALKGTTMISRVCFKVEESGGWCCLNPRWTVSFSLISGSVWNYKHTETYKRRHLSCVSLPLAYLTCNGARTFNLIVILFTLGRGDQDSDANMLISASWEFFNHRCVSITSTKSWRKYFLCLCKSYQMLPVCDLKYCWTGCYFSFEEACIPFFFLYSFCWLRVNN